MTKDKPAVHELWDAVVEGYARIDEGDFRVSDVGRKSGRFVQLLPRYVHNEKGAIHYEWSLRKDGKLEVGLHFEFPTQALADRYVALLEPHKKAIGKGLRYPLNIGSHAAKSSQVAFTLPFDEDEPAAKAPEALRVMSLLIARTWPLLEPILPRDQSAV